MNCARCKTPHGKRYWSDVPKVGDLCPTCHDEWLAEEKFKASLPKALTEDEYLATLDKELEAAIAGDFGDKP